MREKHHPWHAYFRQLPDDSARLMTAITGVQEDAPSEHRRFLPSVDVAFRCQSPFGVHPRFCAVTFEELVGSKGGGSEIRQRRAIRRIATHLRLHLPVRDLNYIAGKAFSVDSPTFRRGRIGSWREEMTTAHKLAFKEIAGQLLVELGYEEDFDW
jgi:hypothetical protein